MYAIHQHLGINPGIVKMVWEGLNNCNTGISKKDGSKYTFEYVQPSKLPDNYKKSANKRPKRVTDEDKKQTLKRWQQIKWICPSCNKTFKNNYKCVHTRNVNRQNPS